MTKRAKKEFRVWDPKWKGDARNQAGLVMAYDHQDAAERCAEEDRVCPDYDGEEVTYYVEEVGTKHQVHSVSVDIDVSISYSGYQAIPVTVPESIYANDEEE